MSSLRDEQIYKLLNSDIPRIVRALEQIAKSLEKLVEQDA